MRRVEWKYMSLKVNVNVQVRSGQKYACVFHIPLCDIIQKTQTLKAISL